MELASQRDRLRQRDLDVAAISYDSPAVLKDFATRHRITFPLLSDADSAVIRRFGLLNPEYPPGDPAYGVPYPGTFVTDAEGFIREKHFAEAYTERRTVASGLALTGEVFGPTAERSTPYFTLRTSASNAEAGPGQRLTLTLDFEIAPGHHAYAPGDHTYRALALKLEPNQYVRLGAQQAPPARPFEFKPLQETVPVYEGRFRINQDVVLAVRDDIAPLLSSPDPTLVLQGLVEYQVCSDTVCYRPGSLPVSWSLRVRPLDRERAPEALRRPTKR